MQTVSSLSNGEYLSKTNPANNDVLQNLYVRIVRYYLDRQYHDEWIKGANSNWEISQHDAQLEMCRRIPSGACVLEVGCGDGDCAMEILKRVPDVRYIGID